MHGSRDNQCRVGVVGTGNWLMRIEELTISPNDAVAVIYKHKLHIAIHKQICNES